MYHDPYKLLKVIRQTPVTQVNMATKGLLERLRDGETILIAEGYLLELDKRGVTKLGSFAPEVVIDRPSVLRSLHDEFVFAGSDVVEAYTYYGHRERMRTIGREDELQKLNVDALRIARDIATTSGRLMAGNLSNTGLFVPDDAAVKETITKMFKEQIEWAVQEGADYIIGETFDSLGEALLALEAIKQYGQGCPAVITMVPYVPDYTTDGVSFPEACRQLEEAGAAVVGLNCARGPATMMPLIKEIRNVCKGPIAAVPVPFRTKAHQKTIQTLTDPETGKSAYPLDLDNVKCTRGEIRQFAEDVKAAGVQYVGLCCGNAPYLMREVAEVFGRNPPASKFSPDLSLSYISGELAKQYPAAAKTRAHALGL